MMVDFSIDWQGKPIEGIMVITGPGDGIPVETMMVDIRPVCCMLGDCLVRIQPLQKNMKTGFGYMQR